MSARNWIVERLGREAAVVWLVSILAGLGSAIALYFYAHAVGLEIATLTGDAKGYLVLAEHLREFHVFSFSSVPPFAPESFRSPGYPLFLAVLLALFGNTGALFVQVVLVSAAPVLLYLLFRPYHERAAFWGAVVFALEPVHLFYGAQFLSDMPFVCLFLLSLVLMERAWMRNSAAVSVTSGAIIGAAVLVRPIAIFLPVMYALYLLAVGKCSWPAWLRAFALGSAALVVISPWMLRNYALFGSWNVSSVGNANLMIYNAPEYLKYHSSEHGQKVLAAFQAEQQSLPREDALSLARSDVFTSTFREIIRGQEMSYGIFHLVKTVPFFITDGLRDGIRLLKVEIGTMPNFSTAILKGDLGLLGRYVAGGGLGTYLFIFGVGFWSAVALLWLWSLAQLGRWRNWRALFLVGALVVYFAVLTGPVSNARYRLPVEGMLLVAAVAAILPRKSYEI